MAKIYEKENSIQIWKVTLLIIDLFFCYFYYYYYYFLIRSILKYITLFFIYL
jgi:hypothetical protein